MNQGHVVVTGAAGALGRAVCAHLAPAGWPVVAVDFSDHPLPECAVAEHRADLGAEAEAGMGAYATSKAGVARLTEALAAELKPRGIRADAVLPSIIDTPPIAATCPMPTSRNGWRRRSWRR